MISTRDTVLVRLVTDNMVARGRIAAALLDHDDLVLFDDGQADGQGLSSPRGEPVVVVIVGPDEVIPKDGTAARWGGPGDTRLLMVAQQVTDAIVERALQAGCVGVLPFDLLRTQLADAIREVSQGGISFPPEVTRRIVFERDGLRLRPSNP